ncbi:MAG: PAS domain S-box protein [Candidatus Hodarchaeales archaeon]|jgi:PAS domain S-box-containing protein
MSQKMRQESLKQILFREDVPTDVKDVIKEYIQDTDSTEKLVEDNEILSTVLETSPVGISLFTGPILGWINNTLAQMIGYKSDFLRGKKTRILFSDEEEYERVIKELLDVPEKIRILKAETTWLHQDGSMINVLLHARPIDISDAGKGVIVTVQDITERKQAEEALRASEEKYRTILESIEDGYYEVDLAGNFTFINDSLSRILGYSINELIGMNNRQYMDEETSKKVYEIFNTVYQKKKSTKIFDYKVFRKDGIIRFVEVSASLMVDSNGKPTGFRGILRDITERKQIEEEIRESEKKYQMLIEKLEEGVMLEDADGLITFVNPRAMNRLGYSEGELLGKHWSFTSPPEDLEKYQVETDKRSDGISSTYESSILSKSGKRIPIIISANPLFSSEGAYEGTLSVFRDISDIKQAEEALLESEQRLREVTENMFDMVSISDMEAIIQYASPSHKFIIGFDPEYLVGKSIIDFVHPDDLNEVSAKIQEGLETLSPKEAQIRYRCTNGDYKWIETMGKFILDDEGNPFRMIFSSHDISESKKAEEELIKTKARLEYLLKSSPAVIYSCEPKGDYQTTFMSENVREITGFESQSFINQPNFWTEKIHPEDIKHVENYFNKISEKGYVSETYRFRHKNGTYLWILEESKLIRDKHGEPIEIIGFWIDITERKEAEEELIKTKARLEFLLTSSPAVIYSCEPRGVFPTTFMSQNVKEIIGYEAQQFLFNPNFWRNRVHPEDRQRAIRTFSAHPEDIKHVENYFNKISEKGYFSETYRFRHKNGTYRWTLEESRLIRDKYGKPIEVIGYWTDITEHKEAEEDLRRSEIRYRKLFEESPVSLWEEDFSQVFSFFDSLKESGVKDYRKYFTEHPEDVAKCVSLAEIIDVNQATLDLYKAKSKEELVENLNRVFVGESYDTFREELIALAEGATKYSIETTGQNLKGEKIYADLGLSISTGYGDLSSRVLVSILDVTKRKQAEIALQESEQRLRGFMDSATDSFSLWDSNLNLVDLNNVSLNMFHPYGAKKADELGKSMFEFVPDLKETGRYFNYKEVIRTGEPFIVDDLLLHPQYGNFHLAIKAFKVGEGLGIISSDVTKQKKLGQKLKEYSERLELILDNVPGQIFYKDSNNKYIQVNKYIADAHNLTKEELSGKSMFDLYPKEEAQAYWDDDLEVIKGGESKFNIIEPWDTLEGRKWVNTSKIPLTDEKGVITGVLGFSVDITEQKQAEELLRESEEKYRNLFNSSPDLIVLIDTNGRIIDCNDVIKSFLGIPKDDIINKHFTELSLLKKEDLLGYTERMSELLQGSEPVRTDVELVDNSGITRDFEAITTLWKRDDEISAVQVLLHEITERKLIEKERIDLDRRRRRFIETTSHELRTPITSVKGFIEMLQIHGNTFSQARNDEIFKVINKNINRLIRLIEDVSDVAKIDREFFRLDRQEINFYNFLNDEINEYKKLLGNHLEFHCHCKPELIMKVDTDRIHQVFVNVVSNALKQTLETKRKIVINAKELLNNMIRIEINDNGAGIDSQNLERIFEPFISIESEYSVRGTGIGLYICRIIVEKHGGTIKAHSDGLGRGATFTIDLPIGREIT